MRFGVHCATCAIIILASWFAFRPVLDNDFVNWGDVQDITANKHYRGFTAGNVAWMVKTIQMGHWQPLSWMTLALDYEIAGMNPRQYHLSALIYHIIACIAVYFLIVSLVRAAWGNAATTDKKWTFYCASAALAGALLFAIHPLRVEPVAWATERRGPVSSIFYFSAIICYLAYARRINAAESITGSVMYWSAVACMALSLTAKEFGVSLPVVLLAIDVYPLRRLNWDIRDAFRLEKFSVLREKIPFIIVAALGTYIALMAAAQSGVKKSVVEYGFLERGMQACYGLVFYLEKSIWPTKLSNLYPIPPDMQPFELKYIMCAAIVAAITLALILLRNRRPAGLVLWICYIVTLLPVLGVVQTGRQIAADRYTYLPAAGFSALVAGGLIWLWMRTDKSSMYRAAMIASTVVIVFVTITMARLTHSQSQVWRDSTTLWTHALAVNPENAVAHNNMAVVYSEQQKWSDAVQHLDRAIAIDPNYAEAHANLGAAYASQGRLSEAIVHWKKALEIDPDLSSAKFFLEQAERRR